MPVVSVQNLFFGEFLVTQLSGRHPFRQLLLDIVSDKSLGGKEVLEELLSIKELTVNMGKFVDEAIKSGYKDIDEVLREVE